MQILTTCAQHRSQEEGKVSEILGGACRPQTAVWERVWNSLTSFGQRISIAIQTFQGAKSKVLVDVAHYNLNPPLTANRGK